MLYGALNVKCKGKVVPVL